MKALHDTLADELPKVKEALREAGYSESDTFELARLFAGLHVLLCFSVGGNDFDRRKVNKVLQRQIASGFSWYAALQFLSGQRAKTIFVKRTEVIRELGGSALVHAFNVILPQFKMM